jgi:hypothetical protein
MSDITKYIDTIFEPDDIVEMRLLLKDRSPIQQWHFAKDLSKQIDQWQRLNEQGYNIYIGVNPRKAFNTSGDDNVLHGRFFFADFDNIDPGDGCGIWEFVSDRIYRAGLDVPDLAIFSGHGIHTYWKLPEPMNDLDRWKKIQAGLAEKLDSDKAIKNPERIMRLPGFKNVKKEPVDCFIL